MKKRGSAIVIAMLLITSIGVITFGIGRALFVQTQTGALYENGVMAYYAAESGIEEGFLMYRYNQNSEIPENIWKINDSDKSYETNLADTSTSTGGKSGVSFAQSVDNIKQIYDLRMGYIGTDGKPYYGFTDPSTLLATFPANSAGAVYVQRDESIKLNLKNLELYKNDTNLNLSVRFYGTGTNDALTLCRALTEVIFTVTDSSGVARQYEDVVKLGIAQNCESLSGGQLVGITSGRTISADNASISIPNTITYELDNLESQLTSRSAIPIASGDTVELTIKPLFYNAAIGLVTNKCTTGAIGTGCEDKTSIVPGPFTEITSIGYYGGVEKKLFAKIDRQSGTLYDLYDYVIFKP